MVIRNQYMIAYNSLRNPGRQKRYTTGGDPVG